MAEILDIIVITLLVIAIVYGAILNRKISLLQQSKQELANLFKSFDDTILQAQIGIDDLKKVSEEVSGLLNDKMEKAYVLIDDLTFLSEKAAKVTNIMDEKVKENQKKAAQIYEERPANSDSKKSSTAFSNPGPDEIKAMRKKNSSSTNFNNNSSVKPFVDNKKAKALESMLEQINENKDSSNKSGNKKKQGPSFSNNNEQDEEKIVANMLKAIGYGDN
jgi:hypothetical protein